MKINIQHLSFITCVRSVADGRISVYPSLFLGLNPIKFIDFIIIKYTITL